MHDLKPKKTIYIHLTYRYWIIVLQILPSVNTRY